MRVLGFEFWVSSFEFWVSGSSSTIGNLGGRPALVKEDGQLACVLVGRSSVYRGGAVSFFRFSKPSLVISYFCDPEKEVNLAFCKKRGIPVYRVISGGGIAFGDKGYVITFLHVDRENPKIPPDVMGMYQKNLDRAGSRLLRLLQDAM